MSQDGSAPAYEVQRIVKALPHRDPLLLVDRVKSLELGDRIHAVKAVTMNEQFFQGHFPGTPIMPGVLQIEAMAQAAAILGIETLELAEIGRASGRAKVCQYGVDRGGRRIIKKKNRRK